MRAAIVAVAAAVGLGCGEATDPGPGPFQDATTLDTSCPTTVHFDRVYTYDIDPKTGHRLDDSVHVTCPPEARGWFTFTTDPPRFEDGQAVGVFHCEWTCVSYACSAGQDVRIDFDAADSRILAITHSASSACP